MSKCKQMKWALSVDILLRALYCLDFICGPFKFKNFQFNQVLMQFSALTTEDLLIKLSFHDLKEVLIHFMYLIFD